MVIIVKKKKIKRTQVGDRQRAVKRRQEILQLIIKAGHPRAISQSSLAKHYGVSQVAISKDISALAKELKEKMPNDAELITHVVMESAIKELSKGTPDQKFKAARLVMDWNNYLFEIGKQKRAPREHLLEGGIMQGIVVNIIQPNNANNKLETHTKTINCLPNPKRQNDH